MGPVNRDFLPITNNVFAIDVFYLVAVNSAICGRTAQPIGWQIILQLLVLDLSL